MKIKSLLIRLSFLIIGLVALYFIVSSFGLNNYINIILSASPVFLLLALLMPLIEGLSDGTQLWLVCKSTDIKISWKDTYWINLWGRFIANFQRVVAMVVVIDSISINTKVTHTESTSRFGLYYAITLIVRVFATGIGVAYFMSIVSEQYQLLVGGFILFVLIFCIIFLLSVFGSEVIKLKISKIFSKIPIINGIINNLTQIKVTQPKKIIFTVFVLAIVNWMAVSAQWYFISCAIGYPINYFFFMSSVSLLSLPQLIPMLPSAIGVYDMVVALGLSTMNVPMIAGLSFTMLERITSTGADSFVVSQPQYLRFFKERMKNGKNEKS
jgi:uncharacterized protein (TIRG00374 family)